MRLTLSVCTCLSVASVTLGAPWFSDHFDAYLAGECADPCTCSFDQAAFQAKWQAGPGATVGTAEQNGTCPGSFQGFDLPFAWIEKKGPIQAVRSFVPEIQAASGNPASNAVNGTADNPLVFSFHLYMRDGKQGFTSLWAQLLATPADHMVAPIRTEGLSTCTNNVCVGGPLAGKACSSDDSCTAMKLEWTGTTSECILQDHTPSVPRASVAFGAWGGYNGILPKPPCANITDRSFTRAVLFDGDAWWAMKDDNVPPGSTGGDFGTLFDRDTAIVMTIRDTTMDVSMTYQDRRGSCGAEGVCVGGAVPGQPCTTTFECRPWVTKTKTGIQREYTGPFQAVAVGTGPIFDGANDGYDAAGTESFNYIDAIDLQGGEFLALPTGGCCLPQQGVCVDNVLQAACEQKGGQYVGDGSTCANATCITGACCGADGTCSETDPAACTASGGSFAGANTLCSDPNVTCCPTHWPDKDADGDVDMDDYGAFQACLTGLPQPSLEKPCQCYDRDHNNSVDELDFSAFVNCVTGPSVPYDPQNLPAGCQ